MAWAVENGLDLDIQQLCRQKPMLDKIKSESIMEHAPRVQQFLNAIPTNDSVMASDEAIGLAVDVLGSLTAALRSRSFITRTLRCIPGFHNRRVKLRRIAVKYNKQAISFMAPPIMVKDIRKRIKVVSKNLAKELKRHRDLPRTSQGVIRQKLMSLTGESGDDHEDICAVEDGSVYMPPGVFQKHRNAYQELFDQQRSDALHARATREAMIQNVYMSMDFISLTSFGSGLQ